ncbi:MAG: DUF5640 domain-containing protein [Gemmatimonadaceae bacterium]
MTKQPLVRAIATITAVATGSLLITVSMAVSVRAQATSAQATGVRPASAQVQQQQQQQQPQQPHEILGGWRADVALPNGVVQSFRFDPDGKFDYSTSVTVDGSYRAIGNQLIETIALPGAAASHTDTATFKIAGDSLMIAERAGAAARVLHRVGSATSSTGIPIIGDWQIVVGNTIHAHYIFDTDGAMHVRAQVSDEEGSYSINGDTLRLANDQSFQPAATAHLSIANDVLTLTPPNGKPPRQFHRITR